VNKNVWSIFSANEAVSFRVVKPFHASLHLDLPPDGRIICFTDTTRMTRNYPRWRCNARSVPERDIESIELDPNFINIQ
jgi:hypothetical protein